MDERRSDALTLLKAGHDALVREIPGWADPRKRVVMQGMIRQWALAHGWTREELDGLMDPSEVLFLFEQMIREHGADITLRVGGAAEKRMLAAARRKARLG